MDANQLIPPLIRVHNLRTVFDTHSGEAVALDAVDFELRAGEVLGVVGESGSGKTLLSLSILGLLPATARIAGGEIVFEGRNLSSFSPSEMRNFRGGGVGMIFQEPMTSFDPVYTIGNQIAESVRQHLGLGRIATRNRVLELLDKVGLPDPHSCYHQYPFQLSGGMRQRAMIAMSLAPNPKLLIADEPTTALDVTIQAQILELLKKLQQDMDIALLFISHDLGVIAEVADNVMVMYGGQVMEHAPIDRLFDQAAHPYTRALMEARPRLNGDIRQLQAIGGQAPGIESRPDGCPFHPRCTLAMDVCRLSRPPQYTVEPTHIAACHLFNENSINGEQPIKGNTP